MILPRADIAAGDVLLGLSSSGLHSNGFSLVRKIVSISGLSYTDPCPWNDDLTLGRALLEPTQIYVKQVLPAVEASLIKGMAHITGGGFVENIPRVLPKTLGCYIDVSTWNLPPVFRFLSKHGNVDPLEMARTFNNGIGMIVIVDRTKVDAAIQVLRAAGPPKVYNIGEVTPRSSEVEMRSLHAWTVE